MSKRTRLAGHVARTEAKKSAYVILVKKQEGNRQLRRPKRRWMDNNKMNLREIGWSSVDWIDLTQDRHQCRAVVKTGINFRFP
jgi:hypothetical protein